MKHLLLDLHPADQAGDAPRALMLPLSPAVLSMLRGSEREVNMLALRLRMEVLALEIRERGIEAMRLSAAQTLTALGSGWTDHSGGHLGGQCVITGPLPAYTYTRPADDGHNALYSPRFLADPAWRVTERGLVTLQAGLDNTERRISTLPIPLSDLLSVL